MGKIYSQDLMNTIKNYLDSEGWAYNFEEDNGLIRLSLNIKSQLRKLNYLIDVKKTEYLVYGVLPVGGDTDDPQLMASLGEFVCRANYGLKNGCFEFDWNDGEIRYKSYVDCDGQLPTERMIRNSIYCVATMVEHYSPGFTGIMFAGESAADAAENCDEPLRRRLRRRIEAEDQINPNLFGEEGDGE